MSSFPNQPVVPVSQKTRKHSAEEINRVMSRFPLIVQILGELGEAPLPFPGDGDIRHGCERALTGMLAALASIAIAPPGKSSKAEETAQSWLNGAANSQLIDADKLQRMQQFIDCILNSAKR